MSIDSHMHINGNIYEDCDKYISLINNDTKLEGVINVGLDFNTSKQSIRIAHINPKFYSSVGIHPLYIRSQVMDDLYLLADDSKVVAIGEIGMDVSKFNFEEQREYLINQIIIANDMHLPIIIHSSNCNKQIVDIFESVVKPKYGCVFHCFQPDIDTLNYLIYNGYYISFAGKITSLNAKKSLEIASIVPNDLFLVETDSPFIKIEPNILSIPTNITYVIQKLADVKQISYDEVENYSINNTKRLFKRII